MKLKKKLQVISEKIERFNQIVISFPLWLSIGLFGFLKEFDNGGWQKSEENKNYGKLY